MDMIKTLALCLAIIIIFGAAMVGLNIHTSKVIADREAALLAGKELLYDSADAQSSQLVDVGANVVTIYKLSEGGFEIVTTASSTYSQSPMQITTVVDGEGKISDIKLENYTDSIDFRSKDANYISTYIGKDSALAEVGLVAGCTYSSTAFKDSVSEALAALISNNLITAGKKSDEQILTELIDSVAIGFAKTEQIESDDADIKKIIKAENDTGFAFIISNADVQYLAVVNAMGVCKVYDTEARDVTSEQSAICDKAVAYAAKAQKSYDADLQKKVEAVMEGAAEITPVKADTFNSVVSVCSFKVNNESYTALYSKSLGYDIMDVYVIIDSKGAIVKFSAKEFIFHEEYFATFGGMNTSEYQNGFTGKTAETFTGDEAIIATATMTSNAVKQSVKDAFESFSKISGGENNE